MEHGRRFVNYTEADVQENIVKNKGSKILYKSKTL